MPSTSGWAGRSVKDVCNSLLVNWWISCVQSWWCCRVAHSPAKKGDRRQYVARDTIGGNHSTCWHTTLYYCVIHQNTHSTKQQTQSAIRWWHRRGCQWWWWRCHWQALLYLPWWSMWHHRFAYCVCCLALWVFWCGTHWYCVVRQQVLWLPLMVSRATYCRRSPFLAGVWATLPHHHQEWTQEIHHCVY